MLGDLVALNVCRLLIVMRVLLGTVEASMFAAVLDAGVSDLAPEERRGQG